MGKDAAAPAPAAEGEVLSLVMDQQPTEDGLGFDPKGMEFKPVTIDGETTPAWGGHRHHPGHGAHADGGHPGRGPQVP